MGDLPAFHVVQNLSHKPTGRFAVTAHREIKIVSASFAVNSTVQISLAAIHFDTGFIGMPEHNPEGFRQ